MFAILYTRYCESSKSLEGDVVWIVMMPSFNAISRRSILEIVLRSILEIVLKKKSKFCKQGGFSSIFY